MGLSKDAVARLALVRPGGGARAAVRERRVLVTGAASGLGAALVARLAGRGDQVLATDLAASVDVPPGAVYQQLDITSEADWQRAFDRVRTELGGLDVLVNNAGIAAGGRVDRLGAAHWQRVLEVNLFGAVNGCRVFVPLFKRQCHGHIVNIASMAGLVHPPAMSSYNAGKAALVALSESMRYELGPWGVAVSVVCPSFFRTGLAASLSGDDPMMEPTAVRLIAEASLGADDIAVRVLRGLDGQRFLILPDAAARIAFWTKRLARPVYDWQLRAVGAGIRQEELSGRGAIVDNDVLGETAVVPTS